MIKYIITFRRPLDAAVVGPGLVCVCVCVCVLLLLLLLDWDGERRSFPQFAPSRKGDDGAEKDEPLGRPAHHSTST